MSHTINHTAGRACRHWLLPAVMLVAALVTAVPAQAVIDEMDVVVSDDPVGWTPHALNGQANMLARIGDRIFVGGSFTRIQNASSNGGEVFDQAYLFAFDRATGAIDENFRPVLDGTVNGFAPTPDGTGLYVGGLFTTVNGETRNRTVLLDAVDGSVDPTFHASSNSRVTDVIMRNGRLYIGGYFTSIWGLSRTLIAEVDPDTGAPLARLDHEFSQPYTGRLGLRAMDVSPDGSRLVAVGNFGRVDGHDRQTITMLDLSGSTSSLANWHTARLGQDDCSPSFDTYVKDVEFAPDGSFFVVGTTGAARLGRLCDTATRWETSATGTNLEPTWVNSTGGDTLHSVGVVGDVVYLGGHQRWLNNPFGSDRARAGAVSRPGVGAVDARNGVPFTWNPTRTRGIGLFDFLSTDEGVYMVSDTDRWGTYEYHARLAMFPSAGGTALPSEVPAEFPGTTMQLDPSGQPNAAVRMNDFDGAVMGAATTVDGSGFDGVRGSFMLSGELFTALPGGTLVRQSFDGTTFGPRTTIDLNGLTTWHFAIPDLNGLTYDPITGRMLYVEAGTNTLQQRGFLPESGIVAAEGITATVNPPTVDWSTVRGLHLAPATRTLYYGTNAGNLYRIDWNDGAAEGTPELVSGPAVGDGLTWGRGLTGLAGEAATPANILPTAHASGQCDGLTCVFNAIGSSDVDGEIVSWEWDFGDGEFGSGESVSHVFDEGVHDVVLTVTDSRGGSDAVTVQVDTAVAPEAGFTWSCLGLTCEVDGSSSSDVQGDVVSWAWEFPGGVTASGVDVSHTFGGAGTHAVTLTVTDDEGQVSSVTEDVTVAPLEEEISFVGVNGLADRVDPSVVQVPSDVRAGDVIMAFVSSGDPGLGDEEPTGVTGWTSHGVINDRNATVAVWSKVADGSEAGQDVVVSMEGSWPKTVVTVAAWRGVDPAAPMISVDGVAETGSGRSHTTPGVVVQEPGAWVVSYWTDRNSSTSSWTVPPEVESRFVGTTWGGGRASSVLADSGGPVPMGQAGAVTAEADAGAHQATMWTIVLRPKD